MINMSDRDAVMNALLSGRRIRLPSGAGDKKRLATCVENIRKEVTSSPERVARDAVAISMLLVPLASNGYRAHDRAFFEDMKATMGRGGIGLDAGRCTSCEDLFLPGTMAEPNVAVMLMPYRPTPTSPPHRAPSASHAWRGGSPFRGRAWRAGSSNTCSAPGSRTLSGCRCRRQRPGRVSTSTRASCTGRSGGPAERQLSEGGRMTPKVQESCEEAARLVAAITPDTELGTCRATWC